MDGLTDDEIKILKQLAAFMLSLRTGSSGALVASDADMDGEYGDPEIRKDPPRWAGKGPSFVGKRYSQCSPEYLDELSTFLRWRADMEDKDGKVDNKDRPRSMWSRKDAALAAGWAKRARAKASASNGAARRAPAAFDD